MFAEGWDIHNFVRMALPDQVHEIVDPLLISQEREEEEEQAMLTCIASILRIGIVCFAQTPGERKDMEEVDTELHSIKEQYKASLEARGLGPEASLGPWWHFFEHYGMFKEQYKAFLGASLRLKTLLNEGEGQI
ncbi:hypothetical protein AgCh_002573 [Apium graveolens]